MKLIQHEDSGAVLRIADDDKIPVGWRLMPAVTAGRLAVIGDDIGRLRDIGLFTKLFASLDEEAKAMAPRMAEAYNATAHIELARLKTFAGESARVRLHECVAMLDALVGKDPKLVDTILKKVRGQ